MVVGFPGLVAIRCGALAIDPVTGGLAAVVGARLDPSTRTVVPVTAPYWLALGEQPDSIQVLQEREGYL